MFTRIISKVIPMFALQEELRPKLNATFLIRKVPLLQSLGPILLQDFRVQLKKRVALKILTFKGCQKARVNLVYFQIIRFIWQAARTQDAKTHKARGGLSIQIYL